MNNLNDKHRTAPFIRLLFPFAIGIWFGATNPTLPTPLPLSILGTTLLTIFLMRKPNFKSEVWFGISLSILLIGSGFILSNTQKFNPQELNDKQYFAILDQFPVEKEKTYKAVIQPIGEKGKILAYFAKSLELDSVQPGTILSFTGKPELIENNGNPFEFDYQSYMNRRKIGHTIFLKKGNFHFLMDEHKTNLRYKALILRNNLLKLLEKNGINGETLHIISAISLGEKDELEKETLQSFSNTGAIHVLAVSGLHVGIIFLLLNVLFRFVKKYKNGILFHTLIMISGLWIYAFITGLSPSVLRAATMFSFLVIGNALNRNSNIFNTLAASAFLLLCIKPSLLFEVGFQLSYSAVIAIVWLQPKFYNLLYFKYMIPDKMWSLLTVSVAAQIGTLPLSIAYFHQFPVYFWLTNMFVIPLVSIILYFSFSALLFLETIPVIGTIFAKLLDWSTILMLYIVKKIEMLPNAVIPNIYPTFITLLMVIAVVVFARLFFVKKRYSYLLVSMIGIAIILSANIMQRHKVLSRAEVVVFKIPSKTVMAFTSGRETTIVMDEDSQNEQEIDYFIKPYLGNRQIAQVRYIRLSDSLYYSNSYLIIKNHFLNFNGLKFVCQTKNLNFSVDKKLPETDVLVTQKINNNSWINNVKKENRPIVLVSKPNKMDISEEKSLQLARNPVFIQKAAIRLIGTSESLDKKITISNVF